MLAFCLSDKYITMNNTNIDQALAALADALKSQNTNPLDTDPKSFLKKIPLRGLSGDHINGGKIINFSSTGIVDTATKQQITITDDSTHVSNLTVGTISGEVNVNGNVNAKTVRADVLEVKEIRADIKFEKEQSVTFGGESIVGKGLLWTGQGNTKQFVYQPNPDRLFSSESIDIGRGKHLSMNGVKVLDGEEIGSSVIKSSLRQVGRLQGLIVDGSVSINDFLFYNGSSDRLGIGTDSPKAALTIAEDLIEVMLGTKDSTRGMVGTYGNHGFEIVTDSTSRLAIGTNGNILLGNKNQAPIQVSVHGTLGVGVTNLDPRAALHVNGAVKFNDKLHISADAPPTEGTYGIGDIVWNANPQPRGHVGWVCTRAGTPGVWNLFGEIK
jgi:hypothetical protein